MKHKIVKPEDIKTKLARHKYAGKKIVFTNGCFDLLHVGHVRYLSEARSKGDLMVLGLNSDKSVRSIKTSGRPVTPEDQRAEVLSGLWCVDYIVIFGEPDPFKLIQLVSPDILVKGADWPEDQIIGGDFVKERGGEVMRIPVVPHISTSIIIERIKNG